TNRHPSSLHSIPIMKFTSFFALASVCVSVFGVDINTLREDGAALANSCAAFGNQITAFPERVNLGNAFQIQQIAIAAQTVVSDLNKFVLDAAGLGGAVSVSDGLDFVHELTPIGEGFIVSLQALQDRKAAIAAIPLFNGVLAVHTFLDLVKTGSDAFKAGLGQYVFVGDALDAWNTIAGAVVDKEVETIGLFVGV
ncbi:hypothetical protein C0991_011823, partial [Blastosporella zonata]